MRWWVLIVGLAAAPALSAQEAAAPKKKDATKTAPKAAPKKAQGAHKKPTPEQIRRFNDLEQKQKKG